MKKIIHLCRHFKHPVYPKFLHFRFILGSHTFVTVCLCALGLAIEYLLLSEVFFLWNLCRVSIFYSSVNCLILSYGWGEKPGRADEQEALSRERPAEIVPPHGRRWESIKFGENITFRVIWRVRSKGLFYIFASCKNVINCICARMPKSSVKVRKKLLQLLNTVFV